MTKIDEVMRLGKLLDDVILPEKVGDRRKEGFTGAGTGALLLRKDKNFVEELLTFDL